MCWNVGLGVLLVVGRLFGGWIRFCFLLFVGLKNMWFFVKLMILINWSCCFGLLNCNWRLLVGKLMMVFFVIGICEL